VLEAAALGLPWAIRRGMRQPTAGRGEVGGNPAITRARLMGRMARRLSKVFGRPNRKCEPMDALIETVLSQNTSDRNSHRAFRRLKEAFPTWERLARASPARVERVIRVGGLAATKSRRIHILMAAIKNREGGYDLRRLRKLDPKEAEACLQGLPGVGPKTRACVLLFGCQHPAFPVDTHVHRIAQRVGLSPKTAGAEATQKILEPLVAREWAMDLHLNLIRLGREVCRPRTPLCHRCPLRGICRYPRGR